MNYQEMNGISDWWDSATSAVSTVVTAVTEPITYGLSTSYNYLTDQSSTSAPISSGPVYGPERPPAPEEESIFQKIGNVFSDVGEAVTYGLSTSGSWVSAKASELTTDAKNKLLQFEKDVNQLLAEQKKVDEAIEALPENSAVRQRLQAKRAESRGIFSEYIAPAYKQFREWAGLDSQANYGGMGFAVTGTMVVTAGAVLAAVSVATVWIAKSYAIERQMLNDPELKQAFASGEAGTSANVARAVQYGAWGLGIVAALYFGSKLLPGRD